MSWLQDSRQAQAIWWRFVVSQEEPFDLHLHIQLTCVGEMTSSSRLEFNNANKLMLWSLLSATDVRLTGLQSVMRPSHCRLCTVAIHCKYSKLALQIDLWGETQHRNFIAGITVKWASGMSDFADSVLYCLQCRSQQHASKTEWRQVVPAFSRVRI